jgi:hypothetical protein
MARFVTPTSGSMPASRISEAVGQVCATDTEPTAKARTLRELAAWYRAFAARAANPAIWEARLLTADDLDAEATRIDPRKIGPQQGD